jgi:ribosome-binding factor A
LTRWAGNLVRFARATSQRIGSGTARLRVPVAAGAGKAPGPNGGLLAFIPLTFPSSHWHRRLESPRSDVLPGALGSSNDERLTEPATRHRLRGESIMKKSIFADLKPREARAVAAEWRADDGVDPREEAKRRRRDRHESRPGQGHAVHKEEQFLAQVRMAIETALQTAAEPILNALYVQDVAVQGGSLVVVVMPQLTGEPVDLAEATQALNRAASMLRREVAEEITRKVTPNLSFVVLPAGAEKVEE